KSKRYCFIFSFYNLFLRSLFNRRTLARRDNPNAQSPDAFAGVASDPDQALGADLRGFRLPRTGAGRMRGLSQPTASLRNAASLPRIVPNIPGSGVYAEKLTPSRLGAKVPS